jgi:hypothetical protein
MSDKRQRRENRSSKGKSNLARHLTNRWGAAVPVASPPPAELPPVPAPPIEEPPKQEAASHGDGEAPIFGDDLEAPSFGDDLEAGDEELDHASSVHSLLIELKKLWLENAVLSGVYLLPESVHQFFHRGEIIDQFGSMAGFAADFPEKYNKVFKSDVSNHITHHKWENRLSNHFLTKLPTLYVC